MFGDDFSDDDAQVFYNKEFVNKCKFKIITATILIVFTFKTFQEASDWIKSWFREKKHNPTEFTQDLPALIDKGLDYRTELIEKHKQNPEQVFIPNDLIMASCIKDYGMFKNCAEIAGKIESVQIPTPDDYVFHMTFCLLKQCCLNEGIPAIIPRVLLNNLALKLVQNELEMSVPLHQNWAMDIFDTIRSDLVPDFITKLKINHLIT